MYQIWISLNAIFFRMLQEIPVSELAEVLAETQEDLDETTDENCPDSDTDTSSGTDQEN